MLRLTITKCELLIQAHSVVLVEAQRALKMIGNGDPVRLPGDWFGSDGIAVVVTVGGLLEVEETKNG